MNQVWPLVFVLATLAIMLWLMRRRALKERFSLWWGVLGVAVLVFAIFPGLLPWVSALIGFATPSNFLFFGALLLLLVISVQFSVELSRLEERARTLAEQVAILRAQGENPQHRDVTISDEEEPS